MYSKKPPTSSWLMTVIVETCPSLKVKVNARRPCHQATTAGYASSSNTRGRRAPTAGSFVSSKFSNRRCRNGGARVPPTEPAARRPIGNVRFFFTCTGVRVRPNRFFAPYMRVRVCTCMRVCVCVYARGWVCVVCSSVSVCAYISCK